MTAKVAVVRINGDYRQALQNAIRLIGGIDELNTSANDVVIKVGVFDPRSRQHACVEAVDAIIQAFDQAASISLAESDSYCGPALERLERCYKSLFTERVKPCNLSDPASFKTVQIAGEEMAISQSFFKPRIFVNTHVLRTFTRGSILKNLFGCTPVVQKSRFHKKEIFNHLLADIFEAAGGIDLTVMDGSVLYHSASEKHIPMDLLIVSRDAVAVETVGAILAGLKPEKNGTIQEFVRRGLGEGDIQNIEIVGVSAEEFAQLKLSYRKLNAILKAEPKSPGISGTIDRLTEEGWLDQFRCASEVVEELKQRGVRATSAVVETTLKRRVGKTLEMMKEGRVTVYRSVMNPRDQE